MSYHLRRGSIANKQIADPIDELELPVKFRMARKAALESSFQPERRAKLGAAVFKGGSFLLCGNNKRKSHPTVAKYTLDIGSRKRYVVVHAETDAIFRAPTSLKGASVYVWREDSYGKPLIARPCEMCMDLLSMNEIKEVFYTTSTFPYWGKERI
jgi:tRNA(Arg) A34 adenosine deaminase TadA